MKLTKLVLPLAGLVAMLTLSGCPGQHDSPSYDNDNKYTTKIRKDDVSDLNDPQVADAAAWVGRIQASCSLTCAVERLIEHDDFFSVAFDLLSQHVRVFSFRKGNGPCALNLTGLNGGMVKADTYNKFDPGMFADPKHLQFSISKSPATGDYCLPNNSRWQKVESRNSGNEQIIRLTRVDQATGEEIWVTTYKGWKGTLMARNSGVIHPMACQ